MSWKRPNYPCISKPIFHSCFRCSLFRNTVKPQFSRGSVILTLLSIGLFFAQRANDAHMILKSDILICGSSLVGGGGRREREGKMGHFLTLCFFAKVFYFRFCCCYCFHPPFFSIFSSFSSAPNGTLKIFTVQEGDEGSYQCVAENDKDMSVASGSLQLGGSTL